MQFNWAITYSKSTVKIVEQRLQMESKNLEMFRKLQYSLIWVSTCFKSLERHQNDAGGVVLVSYY